MPILFDRNDVPVRVYHRDPTRIKELRRKGWTDKPRRIHAPSTPVVTEQVESVGIIKLNLNTATEKELMAIPKVGMATAKKIVEARPLLDLGSAIEVAPDVAWMMVAIDGQKVKFEF